MAVILHMDDDSDFLDYVVQQLKYLQVRGRQEPVFVLSRSSFDEALFVIEGTDKDMISHIRAGRKLDAVILDVLMRGGTPEDVRTWAKKVRAMAEIPPDQWPSLSLTKLAEMFSENSVADLSQKCPAVAAGRLAARRGAKVVILSQLLDAENPLLPLREFDMETQRELIMAACGASAYAAKMEEWETKLPDALGYLLSYQEEDLLKICRLALPPGFQDSTARPRTRECRLADLSEGAEPLRRAPCVALGIQRVLSNLVTNAVHAVETREPIPPVKRIHIFTDLVRRRDLLYARVRVADNGHGLEPEGLKAIFGKQFSTKSGGLGFGSLVVAEHVRKHCGTIEIASALGKGTVVGILLPASELKIDMDHLWAWQNPYQVRALAGPRVERLPLDDLLKEDTTLSDWYEQQGRD